MADPSVGWIKRAVESDSEVGVDWTALGGAKAREMAKLVKPFTDWLGDKRKPKPSEADQFDCLLRLAPYVVELGPPQMDEVESLKLIAFISQLAPK